MTYRLTNVQNPNRQSTLRPAYSHGARRQSTGSGADYPSYPHSHGFWWKNRLESDPTLALLDHRFFWGPRCTRMCPNNTAVQNDVFHVRVVSKMGMHILPDTMITPAGKPFVHTIPAPTRRRQKAPLRSAAHNPMHPFHKKTTACFVSNICPRMDSQKSIYFDPLRI